MAAVRWPRLPAYREVGVIGGVKVYRGVREPLCHVRVLPDEGGGAGAAPSMLPAPRELFANPAPAQMFDWGGDGPGTHYLAIALLADLLGTSDRGRIRAMLPFMRRFLSRLPRDGFEISDTVFQAFLYAVSAAPAAGAPPPPPPGLPAEHKPSPDAPAMQQRLDGQTT